MAYTCLTPDQSGAIEFRSFVGCCYWVHPVTLAEIYVPLPRPSRKLPPSRLFARDLFVSDCALCLQDDQRHSAQAARRQPPSSSSAQVASTSCRAISRQRSSPSATSPAEELGENNDEEEMQDMINQADGDGEISHNEEGQLP